MPFTTVNGVRLRYERAGRGDRVVLVHGSWGDHESWRALAAILAGDHEVVTYDRRGHSASEAPPGPGSIIDDVADLVGLVDHLGGDPVRLVGNSAGATIVLRAAASAPGVVRSVSAHEPDLFDLLNPDQPGHVLADRDALTAEVGPVLDLIDAGANEEAARLFMETVTFGPGAWERTSPLTRDRWTRNAPTFLDQRRDPDWQALDVAALAASGVPIQLISGDQSRPALQAVVGALAASVRAATVTVVVGGGHGAAATHPAEFADALRAFWAG